MDCCTTHPRLARRRRFSPSCRPCHGDDGLQALLASPALDAVLVVLPPQAQGAVIQAALRAGERVGVRQCLRYSNHSTPIPTHH